LINKKLKFDKPTTKDIEGIADGKISEEIAQLLLDQIEELCLIIIEQYASGQKI
jgi:hypothetical protein